MNIKKTALALGSAFMLFATTLSAQEQPWSLGAKVGGGVSLLNELKHKQFGGKDSKSSFNWMPAAGLTAGYAFHENVGVGLEVLYTQLGGMTKEELASNSQNKAEQFRVSTYNLVVPMTVNFFPMGCDPEEGILGIYAGLQAEMPLFGATLEKSNSSDKDKLEKDTSFKNEYLEPFTVSFIAGISYEFPEIGLIVDGRGMFGLMNTIKDETEANKYMEDNGLKGKKLINTCATLSVGYNFARLLMD